ncbi:hypothetical protein N7476_007099 [Penicillium atrosanguineum]|uniref:Uncharacterized protein n=1 Tax=Penicillium atrosanguineum TaxID=1132637 RepID=A0A9W9PTU4_9EURO|nr:hypothetical protein N7476_007099 [Penicillium atrosanguineum]
MSTGMSAYSCMRSIKRVRPSPRNDRSIDVPRFAPGSFRPLSRFRRAMHATCRTISPTLNSIDRTIHNGTGVGNKPVLELWRFTAGQFQSSPVRLLGARGLVTTSVSRSQTATVESDQPLEAILEDAPPVTDEDLSEIEQKIKKKDVRFLHHVCRQSRNLWLEFRFSELAQLFGEETCRAVFQRKGQEKVTVTVTCSAPTKVCFDYPMQCIFSQNDLQEEAERDACNLLIVKLKEVGIWESLSSLNAEPRIDVRMNEDLLFNIKHAQKKLDSAKKAVYKTIGGASPNTSLSKDKRMQVSDSYREKRSKALTESLESIRKSSDKHTLAIRVVKSGLPVNKLKKDILNLVNDHTYSIIVAETGSGKSTQVPQIILDDATDRGEGGLCNVICVQPRRVAAQMLARRVAEERHDKTGTMVGHMVRFDNQMPAKSGAITYCTTGIMLNMLQNPSAPINLYSHILLDEVHVRDVGIDFVMLLLKRRINQLRETGGPVPKIVVMSATLDVDLFSSYFLNKGPNGTLLPAPHISIPGRQYFVKRHYLEELLDDLKTSPDSKSLSALLEERETVSFIEDQYKHYLSPVAEDSQEVALDVPDADIEDPSIEAPSESSPDLAVVKTPGEDPNVPFGLICATIYNILKTTKSGAILVFLPGMAHILSVERMLHGSAGSMEFKLQDEQLFRILKLHSELPEELAKLTLKVPGGCRRILLSTDISEASLTLPDVEYVVDAGRVNQMFSSQKSLSNRMALHWISRSSSSQRAGRAGRVKNGQYFFLGTQRCYDSLRVTNAPEIVRTDLQDICLRAKHMVPDSSISDILNEASESPDRDKVDLAVESLGHLGALRPDEDIAPLGELLVQLPLHPILGKLVILGAIFRCLDPLLILGVIGVDGSLFQRPKLEDQQVALRNIRYAFANKSSSDQVGSINAFKAIRKEWKEKGKLAASDFAFTKFMHFHNFCASQDSAEMILDRLGRMGIPIKADNNNDQFGGAELNVNSENILLVKTLLLHCLSPRIAFPKTYKNGNAHEYQTHSENKKPVVYGVSPSCDGNRSGSVAVYGKKTQISPGQMVMSDLSLVSPLTASLFGGKTRIPGEEPKDDLLVEDFMPINFKMKDMDDLPAFASQCVAHFRYAFSAVSLNLLKVVCVSLLTLCTTIGLARLLHITGA